MHKYVTQVCIVQAKFHYASWFEAGTSFEPASVMEFGFTESSSRQIGNCPLDWPWWRAVA